MNRQITREELIAMLQRIMQMKPVENAVDQQSYLDAKVIYEWGLSKA